MRRSTRRRGVPVAIIVAASFGILVTGAAPRYVRSGLHAYDASGHPTNFGWSASYYNRLGYGELWETQRIDSVYGNRVWETRVRNSGLGASIGYQFGLTSRHLNLMTRHGWQLTARLRLPSGGAGDGLWLSLGMPHRYYLLNMGEELGTRLHLAASTNFSAYEPDSPVGIYVTYPAPTNTYHEYTMTRAGGTETVSVSIDGTTVISNYCGFNVFGMNSISWGAGDDFSDGHAYWESVRLCVMVPQPEITGAHTVSNVVLAIEWFGWSNLVYHVERVDHLDALEWQPCSTTITGRDAACRAVMGDEGSPVFYRLATTPLK